MKLLFFGKRNMEKREKYYIRRRLTYKYRACGEIGRHAILRGWFPMDVLVRVQSCAQKNKSITKVVLLFFCAHPSILTLQLTLLSAEALIFCSNEREF